MSDTRGLQLATTVTSVIVGCLLVTFGGSLLWEHADLPLKTWRQSQQDAAQQVRQRLDHAQRETELELEAAQNDVARKIKQMGPIQFGPAFNPGRAISNPNNTPGSSPLSNRSSSPVSNPSP